MANRRSDDIKRLRAKAAIPGFFLGLPFGMVLSMIFEGVLISRITLWTGLGVMILALLLAEKMNAVPTSDDLRGAEFEEGLNPLGLKSVNEQQERKSNDA